MCEEASDSILPRARRCWRGRVFAGDRQLRLLEALREKKPQAALWSGSHA